MKKRTYAKKYAEKRRESARRTDVVEDRRDQSMGVDKKSRVRQSIMVDVPVVVTFDNDAQAIDKDGPVVVTDEDSSGESD